MIIEFTGFAGVGKTYIRKLLQIELKNKGFLVQDDSDFKKENYLMLKNLRLFIQSICYARRLKSKNIKAWIKSTIVWYKIQCKLKYYSSFSGIVLIDEGYIHKFRLLRRNSSLENLYLCEVYDDAFFEPDIVVLVEANIDTLKLQVKNRDKIELEITMDNYNKSINNTKEDIDCLIEKSTHTKSININNDESFDMKKFIKDICD